MKKILTLALVVAMMLSLAVVASAETLDIRDATWNDGKSTGNITITCTDTSVNKENEKVYYVDITWEDTAMTYTTSGDYNIYNPLTHQYEGQPTTTWTDDTATVKVFNHSNDAITATITIANDTANNGVTLTANATEYEIESAEGKLTNDTSLERTFTIRATGTPTTASGTINIAATIAITHQ